MKKFRRRLRRDHTDAEALLWTHLQNRKLGGYKFRRQHSILNYIVDFYCAGKRVAVELDGAHHFTIEGQLKDTYRDEMLGQLNVKVLRFENKWVFEDLEGVLRVILNTLQEPQ
ncbi:MAG: endonuclease domain-containing protein [Bacteroidota bacterium]